MRPMPELRVEEVATADIFPYARNAKQHTNEQVGQIAASIEEFGFNDPVGVWYSPDGGLQIVEGHGRVLAAQKLGMESVPVVRLDHLTDGQRRAYALVHNKLTLNTGWDFSALDRELEEVTCVDMGDFGFEAFEFDAIEDLMENDFSKGLKEEKDTFYISVNFPTDEREAVERYFAEYGKENVAADIIEKARQWA